MSEAHLYRVARAEAARLRGLAADLVGVPCHSFGGAAAWDLAPGLGQANLRKITPLNSADDLAALDLSGDFGHIFSARAELRWRRVDETGYDILLLSETALNVTGAEELLSRWVDETGAERSAAWRAESPGKLAVIQDGGRPRLHYLAYHAPNGAVLFLRYTGMV